MVKQFHQYSTVVVLTMVSLVGTVAAQETKQKKENGVKKRMASQSAMLKPWTGPYGGVPPWNLVRIEEFNAAFDAAIDQSRADIDAIANNPDLPTFENTLVALEKAGRTLDRLETLFWVHASNLNVGSIPDIERVVAPKLSKHGDSIYQAFRSITHTKYSVNDSPKSQHIDYTQSKITNFFLPQELCIAQS